MARTTINYNAMRPVLVLAHNSGNPKAINEDMILGANIDKMDFNKWKNQVKELQGTVWDYVQKKKTSRYDETITEADLYAARERIFPKWKAILSYGEKDAKSKELRVDPADVEDLVGFCWDFMGTTHGTVETRTSDITFRKKVESLIGCAIAKNEILNDDDRDALSQYYKAQNNIQSCIDKAEELSQQIKDYELLKKGTESEDFREYINNMIKKVKADVKANNEKKARAEQSLKDVSLKVMQIEKRIKTVK